MADKELRKLSRAELLELLIEKTEEVEQLKAQLEEARQQACEYTPEIEYEKAGSLAEASLQVSGVFEAAQRAAQMYITGMEERMQRQEVLCEQLEQQSRDKAEKLIIETELKCRRMEREAQLRCAKMARTSEESMEQRWNDLFARLDQLAQENAQLRQSLDGGDKKRKWSL